MDAKRLFAFSMWRIAQVERPLVVIDTGSGRMTLSFVLRDLARGCLLGRDRIELNAGCPRWRALQAAVGALDVTPENLATLADAEIDAALDPTTGCLTYRALPELSAIRAGEATLAMAGRAQVHPRGAAGRRPRLGHDPPLRG